MGAREDGKNALKKAQKKEKNIFLVLNKYQSVTHVSTFIFKGLFKDIVFISVALVTKKLWAILDFIIDRIFFPPCTAIVSKMRVLGQKNYRGRQTPPPILFRVKP